MSIVKVKEIVVRKDELKPEIEVSFKELSINGQKRLFQENKELFFREALDSEYKEVREMPIKFVDEYSEKFINEVMMEMALRFNNNNFWIDAEKYEIIIEFLNRQSLKIHEDVIKKLACSDLWGIRFAIAKRNDTSLENLEPIFFRAIKEFLEYNESGVLDMVILNQNFELTEKLKRAIFRLYSKGIATIIIARINRLLRKN